MAQGCQIKAMEMIPRATYPGLKISRILEKKAIQETAAIEIDSLVQIARSESRYLFKNLRIQPERSARVQFELISIVDNPFNTRVEAAQQTAHFGEQCLKSATSTLFIHVSTEQGEQAFARLWCLCTDEVIKQRTRTTTRDSNELIFIQNFRRT